MKPIIALSGPTASGKTALSLALAKEFDLEIISSDSMQIYRDMNIGTAKATKEEQAKVKHHLIDLVDTSENYSAERYRADALDVLKALDEKGKGALFVGGTGLYIDTLKRGEPQGVPESDPMYARTMVSQNPSEEEKDALWQRLCQVDPISAEKIHKNNVRRVLRALEIYDKTGISKTEWDKKSLLNGGLDIKMITLDFHQREALYSRIDKRVDMMMDEGLIEEVTALYKAGRLKKEYTASQAIGYKEIIEYLDGECTLKNAVENLKQSSRRYAKRQLTWFRHVKDAVHIYVDNEDGSLKDKDALISETIEICKQLIT